MIPLNAVAADELPNSKKNSLGHTLKSFRQKEIKLADLKFDLTREEKSFINLLIGVANVYNIVHPGFERQDDFILLPTTFGYVLASKYHDKRSKVHAKMLLVL